MERLVEGAITFDQAVILTGQYGAAYDRAVADGSPPEWAQAFADATLSELH